jgi:hypothetical protein
MVLMHVAKGYEFERDAAAIFRALGAKPEHDVPLAGNQIDIVVTERTPSGTSSGIAIECKSVARPVGIDAGLAHRRE